MTPEIALVTALSLILLGQISVAEVIAIKKISVCQTFGSGVVEPFNGNPYYVSTTCPTTLLHFTHKDVDYKIITTRGESGLIERVEITLNEIRTVVQNGMIDVENEKSVSLPYDHMYNHIYPYGIYTKLTSKILDLSVVWRFAGSEIDYLWVELGENSIEEKVGLCWQDAAPENSNNDVIHRTDECLTRTPNKNGKGCAVMSHFSCFSNSKRKIYASLCKENIFFYENKTHLECAFYSAIGRQCEQEEFTRGWAISKCPDPTCPGDLKFVEQGNPFIPICSHPEVPDSPETIQTCVCPDDKVLNNLGNGSWCVPKKDCPCVHGLCGNNNGDTTDDFTTKSKIRENSAEPFAHSWAVGSCTGKPPSPCSSDVEQNADRDCSHLKDSSGIFAGCHKQACVKIVCNCGGKRNCLCVALGNYAKACSYQGISVGDWRKATDCSEPCNNGQKFGYDVRSCNTTCHSLLGPDPTCEVDYAPVEGCGCPDGTYLNSDGTCASQSECQCHYHGHIVKPGPHLIDNRYCNCKDGKLNCAGNQTACSHGKAYVHCYHSSNNTVHRTCASLDTAVNISESCESGCYCPDGQYEDHTGVCVSRENCSCLFSGAVYRSGQSVTSSCQSCTCNGGEWDCVDKPCPGKCEVYGNGHYQTFDSKWY
ncbi:hypothetical protein AAFF_G00096430, partial [Aldrovandia affinis]